MNCPDGTGFVVEPDGTRIELTFDDTTGCMTETFSDGFSEIQCPDEDLSLAN